MTIRPYGCNGSGLAICTQGMGNKRLQFHHVDAAGTADQIVRLSINMYEQSQSTVFHSLSRNKHKDGEIINQHTHIWKLVNG